MRLVLIVPAFPKLSETFIVNKFAGLLERGWDVYVACGNSEAAQWRHFPESESRPDVRARVVKTWPHRPRWLAAMLLPCAVLFCLFRNPAGTWRYLRRGMLRELYLDAHIVALNPGVIHFEFGSLAAERPGLASMLDSKMIASFRGYDLNLSGLERPGCFDEVWRKADALHFLGEKLWEEAQRQGCPPAKPHALIPPAIDVKFFDPAKREEAPAGGPLRILSVGRLAWEKGYEHAIKAMRFLADKGARAELRIVGEGGMLEALAFARYQLGVEESVKFLGALPPSQVRQEMLAADVLLHASVSEGFGNAVIEAQAMGLPVVCSDAGGLSENVSDGETGFVTPRRDARALAEKLALLARDPGLRRRMGQAGRKRALERFQLAGQIEAFDRLYRGVLAEGRRGMRESLAAIPNQT
ncbi:MAG TPA: glycosyltransferase family 4 protein [Verrucomicrobiae bacterium]|jgi:colanic acid/amylovoran biosynthesis glycosyltransferase